MNQDMTLPEIRMELTKIRGHLVPMPIEFLIVSVAEPQALSPPFTGACPPGARNGGPWLGQRPRSAGCPSYPGPSWFQAPQLPIAGRIS